jgi:hypothetical protein
MYVSWRQDILVKSRTPSRPGSPECCEALCDLLFGRDCVVGCGDRAVRANEDETRPPAGWGAARIQPCRGWVRCRHVLDDLGEGVVLRRLPFVSDVEIIPRLVAVCDLYRGAEGGVGQSPGWSARWIRSRYAPHRSQIW